MNDESRLSARERQIMEIVYSLGEASVSQVVQAMPDPPSRSAVRTFLRILEEKGYLKHKARGRQYVYRPATPISRARWSAVQRVLKTFFDGSLEKALALYLSHPQADVSREELQRLEDLIREARQKEGE